MNGVGSEEQTGEGGEGWFQGRHAQADACEQQGGGSVQDDVGRVEPYWLKTKTQVVGSETRK